MAQDPQIRSASKAVSILLSTPGNISRKQLFRDEAQESWHVEFLNRLVLKGALSSSTERNYNAYGVKNRYFLETFLKNIEVGNAESIKIIVGDNPVDIVDTVQKPNRPDLSSSINVLNLNTRTTRALVLMGITTISQLISHTNDNLKIRGLRLDYLKEIKTRLTRLGLNLGVKVQIQATPEPEVKPDKTYNINTKTDRVPISKEPLTTKPFAVLAKLDEEEEPEEVEEKNEQLPVQVQNQQNGDPSVILLRNLSELLTYSVDLQNKFAENIIYMRDRIDSISRKITEIDLRLRVVEAQSGTQPDMQEGMSSLKENVMNAIKLAMKDHESDSSVRLVRALDQVVGEIGTLRDLTLDVLSNGESK